MPTTDPAYGIQNLHHARNLSFRGAQPVLTSHFRLPIGLRPETPKIQKKTAYFFIGDFICDGLLNIAFLVPGWGGPFLGPPGSLKIRTTLAIWASKVPDPCERHIFDPRWAVDDGGPIILRTRDQYNCTEAGGRRHETIRDETTRDELSLSGDQKLCSVGSQMLRCVTHQQNHGPDHPVKRPG